MKDPLDNIKPGDVNDSFQRVPHIATLGEVDFRGTIESVQQGIGENGGAHFSIMVKVTEADKGDVVEGTTVKVGSGYKGGSPSWMADNYAKTAVQLAARLLGKPASECGAAEAKYVAGVHPEQEEGAQPFAGQRIRAFTYPKVRKGGEISRRDDGSINYNFDIELL